MRMKGCLPRNVLNYSSDLMKLTALTEPQLDHLVCAVSFLLFSTTRQTILPIELRVRNLNLISSPTTKLKSFFTNRPSSQENPMKISSHQDKPRFVSTLIAF